VIEEQACGDNGRCSADNQTCSTCTACLGIIALNTGMIVAFQLSATEDMPLALQVSGANEWQVGNFSSVNGIYHLRTDLRDGNPSSLCTRACVC
jgi:hypothetical protein